MTLKMSSDISRENQNIFLSAGDMLSAMPKKETLQEYVIRWCREHGDERGPLSPTDIARISRGAITDSYVRDIINGRSKNPTVDKLQALAKGMGAPEDELFDVARGRASTESDKRRYRIASIFDRAEDLEEGDDQIWFESIIEMVDRELERRRRARAGKKK